MTNGQEELRLGWGNWSLSARGQQFVILLLISSLAVAFLEYQHKGRSDAAERQHDAIVQALEIQTCIQSVPFEERKALREDLRQSPEPLETLRLGWCPWIQRLPGNNKGKGR